LKTEVTPDREAAVPLVSVVIPVYNQVELLDRCLRSLGRSRNVCLEVLVVDDASPEDPGEVAESYPFVRLLRSKRNVGYAAANNLGLAEARGQYLFFLNSDTEVPPDGIAHLVEVLTAEPKAGGVTPLHREPTGLVQRTCFRFPTMKSGLLLDSVVHHLRRDHAVIRDFLLSDWDHESRRWVEHAQTSALLIRREVYDQLGGMDPELFLFYNDTDYCYRMHRAGFSILFVEDVEIIHHGGASVRTFERVDAQVFGDRSRYFRKWYGWKGKCAVSLSLWSRIGYEALVELCHGQLRFAARKIARGMKLHSTTGSR